MSIIGDAKEIATLVREVGNMDLYRKMVDLQGEIVELAGQVNDLKAENRDLKEKLQTASELEWKTPFYRREGDDCPYCPNCWEGERMAVHLNYWGMSHNRRVWNCLRCERSIEE